MEFVFTHHDMAPTTCEPFSYKSTRNNFIADADCIAAGSYVMCSMLHESPGVLDTIIIV